MLHHSTTPAKMKKTTTTTRPQIPPEFMLAEGHALECIGLRADHRARAWLRTQCQPFAAHGLRCYLYRQADVEAVRRKLNG